MTQSEALREARRRNKGLVTALKDCQKLFAKALPCFDWGRSPLTAEAIQLLNEVPGTVADVLRREAAFADVERREGAK